MKKAMKWIVVLAVLAGVGYWYYNAKVKKVEEAKPSYDRAKVERKDLRTTVESTGEVEPRNRLDVKPPIAGRLEELLVDEGDSVVKGQILGWVSSTERATLLDAALAVSKDELEYWENLYKPSPLVSPIKGTVIARNFEPGQSISANDAVVVIADDLIIVANLDETDVGQVKNEQSVEVTLEAYPDREFAGVVEKIAYDAKTVSNVTMYEVDVRPDRVPSFVRSGMTANLLFVIEEKEGALVLPASAIMEQADAKTASKTGGRPAGSSASGGSGGRPDFSSMSPEERAQAMTQRMKERGMSDAEIKERLAQMAGGGGRPGGKGGAKKGAATVSYVFVASGNPDQPEQLVVKTGMTDGSYTEILEGLEEGDEVLIQKISLGSRKSSSSGSSPLMPSIGGGRGGPR
ncbi:efflux RND transporter periplasmic adaptor subunit [Pontiella sulfatireligans]|nr:efflux RND transporter periplasmic adaptor subunit [Pontiella sulfatireligans]